MGKNSRIPWTHHTWNPWMGCSKVSAGCRNCYMFREQVRYKLNPNTVIKTSNQTWAKPMKWNKDAKPDAKQLVFVCSWSDFFHPDADQWRNEAWEVMKKCQNLIFQILTKRPERIEGRLPVEGWPQDYFNVWLGVSVEDKNQLGRIWHLVTGQARRTFLRFISAEPLLEDITPEIDEYLPEIDWVIAGGESGPDCRKMDEDWARNLRNHCQFFDVPFFLKQLGGHPDKREMPELDGKIHVSFPEAPDIWNMNTPDPVSMKMKDVRLPNKAYVKKGR